MKACDILLERMKPMRVLLINPTWKELVSKCHLAYISLSAQSMQVFLE